MKLQPCRYKVARTHPLSPQPKTRGKVPPVRERFFVCSAHLGYEVPIGEFDEGACRACPCYTPRES